MAVHSKKLSDIIAGFAIGTINSLFGAGGGMLTVPYLKKSGLPVKEAHATSISIILPLSIISAFIYLYKGACTLSDAAIYLPGSFAGALLGAFMLKKTPDSVIKKIFAVFIIYAAIKLFFR